MFCEEDYKKAYDRLSREYGEVFGDALMRESMCPPKRAVVTDMENGIVTGEDMYMPATLMDGTCGRKIIHDQDGHASEHVYIRTVDGRVAEYRSDRGITVFRCGLMTCVAVSSFDFMGLDKSRVGFIGNGRMNLSNLMAMKAVFGTESAVIRGSERDRGKNHTLFSSVAYTEVDESDDMGLINSCDIVVVCTSNVRPEGLISTKKLYGPRLIVALDSGYTLDRSFREASNVFTDYSEQLENDYRHEFPFDGNVRPDVVQLTEAGERAVHGMACVYLYGIAYADVLVAEMVMNGEIG